MKQVSPFVYKTAKVLSVLGHPLLTISLVALYAAFWELPTKKAVVLSVLLLGGVIAPVIWYNYRQVKRGHFTNFDVSDQGQRAQFYPVLIGLLSLVTGLLLATHQPRLVCYAAACAWLLVVSSYGVNQQIKASLHASFSFFLTWVVYLLNQPVGLLMGVFSILIGGSRVVLRRHTLPEVLVGAMLGVAAGASLYEVALLTH